MAGRAGGGLSKITESARGQDCPKRGAQTGNTNGLTHGDRRKGYCAPEYTSWLRMKERCQNESHVAYENYGGRGIVVCERWSSYPYFLADMGRRPSAQHSLDRIDNDIGYFKDNCRWSTKKEQSRNRRDNTILEHQGRKMCVADWADFLQVSRNALYCRLKNGWSVERVLTEPISKRTYR